VLGAKNGKFYFLCAPHCSTNPLFSSVLVDWLPAYLDLFALGMLLAVLSAWFAERDSEPSWLSNRFMPWISWAAAAASFVVVAHVVTDYSILPFLTPRANLERQALYGLFAFFLLLPAVFGPQDRSLIRRFLCSWPMASLGVISYGIYLWHLDFISIFLGWMGWQVRAEPFWVLAAAVFGLSVAFASASYFGLERPILRYKGRIGWWDRQARPGADPQKPDGRGADAEVSGSGR
jgi:peptidoglycan/LPS O-acetylase OafA/YrhL